MEERIIDDEYGRGVRLRKTKDGYVDVTDTLAETDNADENANEETLEAEEISFEFPDIVEEEDEDLIGLDPEEAARIRAERAAEEEKRKAEAAARAEAENAARKAEEAKKEAEEKQRKADGIVPVKGEDDTCGLLFKQPVLVKRGRCNDGILHVFVCGKRADQRKNDGNIVPFGKSVSNHCGSMLL